jgi:hypothetical protein
LNVKDIAADLRAEADRLHEEIQRLQDQADTLLNAADALDPPQPAESLEWDAAKAAAMRRQGRSWDEIRHHFGLELSDAGIAHRLRKANYGWGGQSLEAKSESGDGRPDKPGI